VAPSQAPPPPSTGRLLSQQGAARGETAGWKGEEPAPEVIGAGAEARAALSMEGEGPPTHEARTPRAGVDDTAPSRPALAHRQFDKDEQAAQEIVRCVNDGRNGCSGTTMFFERKP
jgi:hypothetical protein